MTQLWAPEGRVGEPLPSAGGYLPFAELGRGGMGVAYLSRRLGAGAPRLAVVKRPHPELMRDPVLHQRFHHEAALATSVRHGSLVETIGAGEDAHGPYLLLEYVHGTSWEDLVDRAALRGEALPVDVCLRIASRCALALSALHRARGHDGAPLYIVHRDVSPQNVLVSLAGQVKLGDLGVAKSRLRHASTGAHSLLGKLPFMAPEYLRERRTGPALDVYALGVTLWMVLAGRSPFRARSEAELVRQVLLSGLPKLSTVPGDFPQALVSLVEAAVERDPGRRPSVRELHRGLQECLAGQGPSSESLLARIVGDLAGVDLAERVAAWDIGAALDDRPTRAGRGPPRRIDPSSGVFLMGERERAKKHGHR